MFARNLFWIGSPDITTPGEVEPTPWERYTYDASDNAGRTPVEAPTEHHDTPTSVVFDAKGRTIKTVERNGRSSSDELVTQTDYDINPDIEARHRLEAKQMCRDDALSPRRRCRRHRREVRCEYRRICEPQQMSDEYVRVLGNVTKVIDPEGRDAAVQVFDLADNKLRTESIDAGNSISVFDAAGISVETRDAKGGLSLKRADNLGRTTHVWGRDNTGESVRLCERVIFGDAAGGPSSPKADNHLGKPYRHYDEAGRVNFEAYDFKGKQIQAHIVQKTPLRGTAEWAKRRVEPWTRCRRHRGNVRHEIRALCKPQ